MTGRLALLCGSGPLPVLFAQRCAEEGRDFLAVSLGGLGDPALTTHPHADVPIGALGAFLSLMRAQRCTHVLMCGKVTRPKLRHMRLDAQALAFGFRVLLSWGRGDDAFLRSIARLFESHGLTLTGPAQLWPDLLAPLGQIGTVPQPPSAAADLRAAAEAARALGAADRGQAAVARGGRVIALEDRGHTDGLLHRVAAMPGAGGVLVKRAKPQQDRRLDLPVIGPHTILAAHAARLDGIALGAGGVLIAERERLIAEAGRLGLFITGIPEDAHGP